MTIFLKDPNASIDYSIDWDTDGYLADGETISTSTWVVDPVAGVTTVSSSNDTTTTTITISGGTAGQVIKLVNRIVTSAGRTDDRTITVRIEDR
jgi:hypothetical protein